jgi:L-ascorbate metabolism protein UlaG (beta-lactamase superfamily)
MRLTFVWQDCVVVGSNGTSLITNPCFPKTMKVVSLDDLPRLDGVVVTHPGVDTLSWDVLEPVRRTIPVICPRGTEKRIRKHGFVNIYEVHSGKALTVGDVRVVTLPSRYTRESFGALFSSDKNVYYAGPTFLFDKMAAIGNTYPIDLALLPIGGRTRGERGVMSPDEASDAAARLKAKAVVPIHWHPARVGEAEVRPSGKPEDLQKAVREKKLKTRVRVLRPSDAIII